GTHTIHTDTYRPGRQVFRTVCVCLSLCVVHAQCCQVPGSPCRTDPAGMNRSGLLAGTAALQDTHHTHTQGGGVWRN
ncbi:MAG: hypothetical protein ACK559_39110, partial [bacterium]